MRSYIEVIESTLECMGAPLGTVKIATKRNRWNNKTDLFPKFQGKMIFPYGNNKAPWVTATSTIDAIRKGERTGTTRYASDGHLSYWMNAKVGDIIRFNGWKDEKVFVEVTKPLHLLTLNNTSPEEWCRLEGWNYEKFENKIRPKILQEDAYQMEFKYLGDSDRCSYFYEQDFNEFNEHFQISVRIIEEYLRCGFNKIVIPNSDLGKDLPIKIRDYMLTTLWNLGAV